MSSLSVATNVLYAPALRQFYSMEAWTRFVLNMCVLLLIVTIWVLLECWNSLIWYCFGIFWPIIDCKCGMLDLNPRRLIHRNASHIRIGREYLWQTVAGAVDIQGQLSGNCYWNGNKQKISNIIWENIKSICCIWLCCAVLCVVGKRERMNKRMEQTERPKKSERNWNEFVHVWTHEMWHTTGWYSSFGFLIVPDFSSNQMNEYLIRSSPNINAGISFRSEPYQRTKNSTKIGTKTRSLRSHAFIWQRWKSDSSSPKLRLFSLKQRIFVLCFFFDVGWQKKVHSSKIDSSETA